MPTKIGTYDQLSRSDEISFGLTVHDVAKAVVNMNYGVHRLLSAIVYEIRSRPPQEVGCAMPKRIADAIEELLNSGLC